MADEDGIVRAALLRVQRCHEAAVSAAVCRSQMASGVVTIGAFEASREVWESVKAADRDAQTAMAAALRAMESALIDAGAL